MIHRKSFFDRQTTAVTALFAGESIEELIAKSRNAEFDGADGIAVEISSLAPELRTVDQFRRLMNEVHLPYMFICYRSDRWFGTDDEARQEYLLRAAEAGAEVIDVMGDLYDPSPLELTMNPDAVARQKALIEEIHARGAKALMSSHMHTQSARTAEEVLGYLREQRSRNADILKIVTAVNTEAEFLEAIRTTLLLNREFDVPFIHLCNGQYSRMHRFLATKLGVAITFGVSGYENGAVYSQPTIRSFKSVIANIPWDIRDVMETEH